MIDPLSGATAFTAIVQLLAIYRQERGARKDLDHRDFIEWLNQHHHEEIKELITNTYHLQSQVDDLLREDHVLILQKLDEVNQIAAGILARLDEFSAVANIVVPNLGLSLQTMGLLRLLARSKTGRFILMSEDQFAVDTAFFHPADPKILSRRRRSFGRIERRHCGPYRARRVNSAVESTGRTVSQHVASSNRRRA